MSRAQQTPGPWAARGKYVFAGGDCIGICDTDNASDGRMEANARLIAAAPEMYEALKLVMQHGRIDDSEHRMNLVAAAIAKAEAQQ